MHVSKKYRIGASLTAATAAVLALTAGVANADTGARPGDIVGVGSDTAQYAGDFVLDGYPGTAAGYNLLGGKNRVDNVFASGDANGRATYDGNCGAADASGLGQFCGATTNLTPNLLPGTVTLRDGSSPVVRPNGSGAGAAALIADAVGGTGYQGLPLGSIQYARMSRLPNSTEEGNCPTTGSCGGLHVYQFGTDTLAIAHENTGTGAPTGNSYNGPSTGLSAQDLVTIYSASTPNCKTWHQIDSTDASTNVIHPLIPQSGSGTRNFFLADLQAANGGTAITLGSCVRTVQEHDPSGIYQDSSAPDAIEPFSTARIALINKTYFANAGYTGTGYPQGAFTPNFLAQDTTGNAQDGNPVYDTSRGIYFTIRNADLASTTPIQPGGSLNWAQTLFAGAVVGGVTIKPTIQSTNGQNAIAFAGFTPAYKDCGINPTTC
jgi:hypothetical protein